MLGPDALPPRGELLIAGVIHLLPLSGILGARRLSALYGLPMDEPNLLILMRHGAVLFGLLGVLLVAAAFAPGLRTTALVADFVSVLSFLSLAGSVGGYSRQVARIVAADRVALLCLVVGAVLHARG